MRTVDWVHDHVVIIDQTRLPGELTFLELRTVDEIVDAIARLAVRGAPALGVMGALGVAVAVRNGDVGGIERIRTARPTAVNLAWGVALASAEIPQGADAVLGAALALIEADIAANRAIGERGADFLSGTTTVLTHCNAGALACVEWGTALGVVRSLHGRGQLHEVIVDETRPLLQGARLTAFELEEIGVPYRVVVDSAGPSVIARGMVDAVIVGADRIAANFDVANKIGTYPLALAAARHGTPFIVAAPESTIDLDTRTGADIEIEERDPSEVTSYGPAFNPAFDVTPADLVTAIITEARIITP